MLNKSIALNCSWNVVKYDGKYYIAYTHWIYLKYIVSLHYKVFLLTTCRDGNNTNEFKALEEFDNLEIIEIPYKGSFLKSLSNLLYYYRSIKKVKNEVALFYCRVPDPYSWMPLLLFKKQTIIHFVGDAIDATKHNEKWNLVKKSIMIIGYLPDYCLTLLVAKRSKVYANGFQIVNKLKKYSIKAEELISSTVSINDIPQYLPKREYKEINIVNLIYIGYIRYAKGINTLMSLIRKLYCNHINFHFDIIGTGEMFEDIENFIQDNLFEKCVTLHGMIDDRNRINTLLQNSDLFVFPSLSEGSPRVIIEAMAQGIPIISTPVGSLPTTFVEGETIRFFDYNDVDRVYEIVIEFIDNPEPFIHQRDKAYEQVKNNYTMEAFLGKIFTY